MHHITKRDERALRRLAKEIDAEAIERCASVYMLPIDPEDARALQKAIGLAVGRRGAS